MKLTKTQRETAKAQLIERLEKAIEETPQGISNDEVSGCVLRACVNQTIIK